MPSLRDWREKAHGDQANLAKVLGKSHKTYSAYERGALPIPEEIQGKLRDLGYHGPWPREEADPASAAGAPILEGHIEQATVWVEIALENRRVRPQRRGRLIAEVARDLAEELAAGESGERTRRDLFALFGVPEDALLRQSGDLPGPRTAD